MFDIFICRVVPLNKNLMNLRKAMKFETKEIKIMEMMYIMTSV